MKNGAREGIRSIAEKFLSFINYQELIGYKDKFDRIPAPSSTNRRCNCSQEFDAVIGISARIGSGFAHQVKPYLRLAVATELRHYLPHTSIAQRDFLEDYVTM
jgi:hypothetical protein